MPRYLLSARWSYDKWILPRLLIVGIMIAISRPDASAQNLDTPKAEGLAYHLPKQILLLETTTTTETRRGAREQRSVSGPCDSNAPVYPLIKPPAAPKPTGTAGGKQPPPAPSEPVTPAIGVPQGKLCIEENVTTNRAVNAQLKLVPDLSAGAYRLAIPGKALADVKLSVEMRDGSTLKGLNVASQGRAGDVILGIARFAATVLGSGVVQFAQAGAPPAGTDCNPFLDPFDDRPDFLRLLLSRNSSACEAWTASEAWNEHAQKLAAAVKTSEETLGGTSFPALNELIARLKEQRKAVDDAKKMAAAYQATVMALLDDFTRTNALGTKKEETRSTETLDLSELPNGSVDVKDGETDWVALQNALGSQYGAAKEVLKRSGVIARMIVMKHGDAPTTDPGGKYICSEGGNDRLDIWFRPAQPVTFQFFVAETPVDDGRPRRDPVTNKELQIMKLAVTRIEPVTFLGIKPRCVTFKASAFANRELIVSFDERGQLAKIDATAGSSAAAALTALASAATTFRDEYAATVAKMVDIDQNERKLKLNDVTTRVEQLKKDRERLDAQLALEAGTANYDLALQQQKLAAQAAELQAQAALDLTTATADQKLALEEMKLQIEIIKRELELLKAQQELSDGRK